MDPQATEFVQTHGSLVDTQESGHRPSPLAIGATGCRCYLMFYIARYYLMHGGAIVLQVHDYCPYLYLPSPLRVGGSTHVPTPTPSVTQQQQQQQQLGSAHASPVAIPSTPTSSGDWSPTELKQLQVLLNSRWVHTRAGGGRWGPTRLGILSCGCRSSCASDGAT